MTNKMNQNINPEMKNLPGGSNNVPSDASADPALKFNAPDAGVNVEYVTNDSETISQDYSFILSELKGTSVSESIKIQVNEKLEDALRELESLHDKYSEKDAGQLLVLCKNTVIESITGQFGMASMFIAAKDGGSSTTTHNFKKGITSTDADKNRHETYTANNDGSREWNGTRKEAGYDKGFSERRKKDFQTKDMIIDGYTGKPLPKDGRAHIDHVVSAKEIESQAEYHLYRSSEERAKMATSDKNTTYTEASANQSKGDAPMKEWLDKKSKSGETNAERYGIDRDKALKIDAEARKSIQLEVTVAAVKKHSKELLATGGADAAKMAAYHALGAILRDLTQAVFEEVHITFRQRGNESLKEIGIRFQTRTVTLLTELKAKWKDILTGSLEAGLTAFLSNIVIFVINLFFTTLKKLVSIIRAGFVSLCQAVKILASPPEGMDREEVNYQALKILTAGLIGAASLGLNATIEKLLEAVPGLQPLMMFPVPFPGEEPRTVSDILAATLSALAGGLLTTVALYFMDKARNASKKDKLQIQLVTQGGVVVQYKISQTWLVLDDAYYVLHTSIAEGAKLCIQTKQVLEDINQETLNAVDGFSKAVDKLRMKRNAIGRLT